MQASTGALGAANELAISIDLIRKGFDVFRNLSPNGPTDLVAIKNGRVFRVQVKSTGCGEIYKNDVQAAFNNGDITYTVPKDAESLFENCKLSLRCGARCQNGDRCRLFLNALGLCRNHPNRAKGTKVAA